MRQYGRRGEWCAGHILCSERPCLQHHRRRQLHFNFDQKKYEYFCKVGIIVQRNVGVLPESSEIRVVLRDAGSGGLGSVYIPVKEFYRPELLLAAK